MAAVKNPFESIRFSAPPHALEEGSRPWTDDEGHRWRVTDVVAETRNGKRVPWPVALGNSIAKWRVFTRDDVKARRVYRFRADQQHGVTEVTLASNSGRARHAERAPPDDRTRPHPVTARTIVA